MNFEIECSEMFYGSSRTGFTLEGKPSTVQPLYRFWYLTSLYL